MKRFFASVIFSLIVTSVGVRGQGLDDQYFAVFSLIQEADSLSGSEPAKALGKYIQAQTALQRFQKGNPEWNPRVVGFRLAYVATKLAGLSSSPPAARPGSANEPARVPQSAPPDRSLADPVSTAAVDLKGQVSALQEQLKQMQSDRALMEAKLKEALAAQPAESDPRELARAEEKIKILQKENELLKASVEGSQAGATAAEPKNLEQAQRALAEANHQLGERMEMITRLTVEREALQARLKANPDLAALQVENELLKKQILASNAGSAAKPKAAAGSADASRVSQLEREKDELQKRLDAANKAAASKKGKAAAKQAQELELQLSTARARLEVLEARAIPYTAEELALLKQPQAILADPQAKSAKKSELSPASAKLMAEAQSFFTARQYDKAEAAYGELLKQDPKNVLWLANIAAIQVESGKLDAAEANVKAALAEKPEDSFSLYIFGITKLRQAKFDDALDALSRAAKLDPQNAEVQNYLGLVLSEKGMRGPAEAALRKAIQLQPGYAQAHYNLAVAYLSQKPPATELARWHYQKALALHQPRNADFERKLESK